MDELARRPARERSDLFTEAAAKLGVRPTIVEKDFWVCFTLNLLFTKSSYGKSLVLKGGTSLSKVYRLIERFSEDIDLVLDWRLIGFGEGRRDPMQVFPSKTKQDRFNKEIHQLGARFIADELCPGLDGLAREQDIGLSAGVDENDSHVVNVRYPAVSSEAYIRPEVRLEIGPLASWVPSAVHRVRPYVSDVLPEQFRQPECPVVAIAAERTFWEKATILHQEAHRDGTIPQRYSRHYYDVYRLSASAVREAALAQTDLLRDVVAFKERFYPCNWARYEEAKPGTLRLLPGDQDQLAGLERDYREMQVMLFGEPPVFNTIVEGLKELEGAINSEGSESSSADRV